MTAAVDRAVQPERTELAWRRTALAICCGSLLAMRALPELIGTVGLVLCGVGVIVGAALWVLARPRCRAFRTAMAWPASARPGATQLMALTLFTTTVGITMLYVVASSAGSSN